MNGINRSHGLTRGNRGGYSSLITSIISFTPSLNPAINISRSEMENMSVIFSVSLSNSSFCSWERDIVNKILIGIKKTHSIPFRLKRKSRRIDSTIKYEAEIVTAFRG